MRIKFPGDADVAGARAIGVSKSVNGRRRLFTLADDGTATGAAIEIPDEPQFVARLCEALMTGHIKDSSERPLDRRKQLRGLSLVINPATK